ncbi:MAG: hypothetical protein BWY78_00240 [Alphaproteobacteria bacterium ADurb.Bin438]|nr:MAG: hypothetical protein BWY78_00240 [Alphaproteobacteria bacterium ADurb.Bin438]
MAAIIMNLLKRQLLKTVETLLIYIIISFLYLYIINKFCIATSFYREICSGKEIWNISSHEQYAISKLYSITTPLLFFIITLIHNFFIDSKFNNKKEKIAFALKTFYTHFILIVTVIYIIRITAENPLYIFISITFFLSSNYLFLLKTYDYKFKLALIILFKKIIANILKFIIFFMINFAFIIFVVFPNS